MAKEVADRGNSWSISALDRSFGGKETEVFRVSGGGLNTLTQNQEVLGDVRITPVAGAQFLLNNSLVMSVGNSLFTGAAGVAAAGPVTLAGTKVGDKVLGVIDITTPATPTNAASSFETTISTAGSIAQTSASNLSAHGFLFFIAHVN